MVRNMSCFRLCPAPARDDKLSVVATDDGSTTGRTATTGRFCKSVHKILPKFRRTTRAPDSCSSYRFQCLSHCLLSCVDVLTKKAGKSSYDLRSNLRGQVCMYECSCTSAQTIIVRFIFSCASCQDLAPTSPISTPTGLSSPRPPLCHGHAQ